MFTDIYANWSFCGVLNNGIMSSLCLVLCIATELVENNLKIWTSFQVICASKIHNTHQLMAFLYENLAYKLQQSFDCSILFKPSRSQLQVNILLKYCQTNLNLWTIWHFI